MSADVEAVILAHGINPYGLLAAIIRAEARTPQEARELARLYAPKGTATPTTAHVAKPTATTHA